MSTTNILDLNNRIDALEKNSGGGSADSAKRSDIATEFSATTAYTAGCFVYYEGKLYQFNADHSAGAWDPTDVVEANVTDQIVSNKSAIAGLTASDVAYDNITSELTATNIQGAVDELAESYPATQVMLSDGVTSVEDKLSGYIVIQNISPSSPLTWTHGDYTYFDSYKPSDTDYTWYLLNVMPTTASIIICGIETTRARALVYLPAGGSIQAGCSITWLGVKN